MSRWLKRLAVLAAVAAAIAVLRLTVFRPRPVPVCFVLDRSDSTLGVLFVLSSLLPVSTATWIWALVLGPASHAAFSGWLYRSALKARPL